MASVDDTVRESIWNYPSINSRRIDALHHYFCVLGNGYSWRNGEIVEEGRFSEVGDDEDGFGDRPSLRTDIATVKARENIERLVTEKSLLVGSCYPLSDGCLITKIPDDVTDDWLAACEEMLDACSSGYRLGSSGTSRGREGQEASRDRSMKFIKKARKDTARIKKLRGLRS